MTDEVREWRMYGARNGRGTWWAVGDHQYVRIHGVDPVPVSVTEDGEGDYLGWIQTGESEPCMIQHRQIFNVQFPYGYAAEVAVGHGEAVRLRVEEVPG
jgi:hypothetical protein